MNAATTKTKNEVAHVERTPVAPYQSESAKLLSFISDPAVDMATKRELIALRREILADENEHAFNDAMAAAQSEMVRIATDSSNPQTHSKYASYAALDRAVRPIYTKNGFSLSFDTDPVEQESTVRVVCYVSARGHTRKYHIDMPADGKGPKGNDVMTKTHAAGSAVSYGRRYLLIMIFNLAIGQDDDGNAAGGGDGPISQEQIEKIQSLIVEVGADIPRFCKYMGVARIEEISAKKFKDAVSALEQKRKAA